METFVTICGNLVADPEKRTTTNGTAVTGFRLASTPRRFDASSNGWKDGPALFINVSCWRSLAEGVWSSLHKGDPVIVHGRLILRQWADPADGRPRTSFECDAVAVGPDLTRTTCTVSRRTGYRAADPSYVESLGRDVDLDDAAAEALLAVGSEAPPREEDADELSTAGAETS